MSRVVNNEMLLRFAKELLQEAYESGGGDIDGGWLQDTAFNYGLLEKVTVTEPCGDNCHCAEWDDFPQDCFRIAQWLRR